MPLGDIYSLPAKLGSCQLGEPWLVPGPGMGE